MAESLKVYVDSANWLCEINLLGFCMINRYLTENNHSIVDKPSDADFIIINSCGFTKRNEDATINLYRDLLSKKGKKTSIILFGCLIKINPTLSASLEAQSIDYDDGDKFDKIFFNKIKFEGISPSGDSEQFNDLFLSRNVVYPTKILPLFVSRIMAPFSKQLRRNYQKIIDNLITKNKILVEICRGCASKCKYCTIKKTRGGIRSRQINEILEDVEKFYDPTKELFLVADDCSCYGMDINTNLFELLYAIKKKFPGLLIDLDNINPCWLEKFPDDFIRLLSGLNIGYVTIPLQSGSNKIVKEMNRDYDVRKIRGIVKQLKKASPKTAIYSHFIICYPQETLMDFLRTVHCAMYFDLPIAFQYSAPKDQTSTLGLSGPSRITKITRMLFFMIFLNFTVFFKLLKMPNQEDMSNTKNNLSS